MVWFGVDRCRRVGRGSARMEAWVSRVASALFLVRCSVPPSVRVLRSWFRRVSSRSCLAGWGRCPGEGYEWPGSFSDDAHEGEVLPAGYSSVAAVVEDALDADGAEAGGAH